MMKLNINDYMECDSYCFDRSWMLRRFPDNGRRLIHRTLDLIALSRSTDDKWLTDKLTNDVRKKNARNPVLIFFLLRIVVPIIIKLVVEWWKKRKEN